MRGPLSAALRALPSTFALYICEAVFALSLSLPLHVALSGARHDTRAALGRAANLEHLLDHLAALEAQAWSIALLSFALCLLSPWLSMAWLEALAEPVGPRTALRLALPRYGDAARLLLLTLGGGLFGLGVLWAAFEVGRISFDDLRSEDLLFAALLFTASPLLMFAHALHDLARAQLRHHEPWPALRAALRLVRQEPRVLAEALGYQSVLLAGVVGGSSLALRLDAWSSPLSAATSQVTCFTYLFVRSVWLAHALACVQRAAKSRERTSHVGDA